jgi:hypothetical protein
MLARIAIDGASTALAAHAGEAVKVYTREQIAGALATISPTDSDQVHAGEAAAIMRAMSKRSDL